MQKSKKRNSNNKDNAVNSLEKGEVGIWAIL